jgi:signal transduction histidine kinase
MAEGVPSDRSITGQPGEATASDAARVEALGRLAGGVVHDFNNLLGVVSNSAHLIQRQASGPELQAPVAATLRAVEAGSRLTQHLMRFAGRQPSPPPAVDLASTLAEANEFLQAIAGRRIELSVAVAPATRHVMVDESGLELALTTLTLNARDAMPSGGRLRLHACNAVADDTSGLPDGDYVLITVGDEGRGDGDASPATLNLRQVLSFCVRSGGTSRRASTPGLGTTVSMLLPAC